MKKVLSVLLALMMLAACGTVFAEQEARKIETPADADEWIATLFGEHPEELEDAYPFAAALFHRKLFAFELSGKEEFLPCSISRSSTSNPARPIRWAFSTAPRPKRRSAAANLQGTKNA